MQNHKSSLENLFKTFKITGICTDSRKLQPGDAFFAIRGTVFDGNQYITKVLELGAALSFTDNKQIKLSFDTTIWRNNVVFVENIRDVLADAADILYPKLPKYLLAVTGTNGKSSIVSYCQQILDMLGAANATIGTLGLESNHLQQYFSSCALPDMTTPDLISLRRVLNDLAINNINYVAIEASSHGLDQGRLQGLYFSAAGFSSFSQDHLDYHLSMEDYLQAKLRLFNCHMAQDGVALLNDSLPDLKLITNMLEHLKIRYYIIGQDADIDIISIKSTIDITKVVFKFLGVEYEFSTAILGNFQIHNILMAMMLIYSCGFAVNHILHTLPKLQAPRGRLERVSAGNIFVDYAHTPDALERALLELEKLKLINSRLWVVFGCGGNRDKTKRALMGKIACQIACVVVVTDDNPRYEDSASIRQEIIRGAVEYAQQDCNKKIIEISDRQEAIIYAINNLNKDDILLIAGKGHEEYQIIRDQKIYFSDVQVASKALGSISH